MSATKKTPVTKPTAKAATVKVSPTASAQAILQSMLMPGERILHVAAISPGIYWKGVVVFGLGLLLSFAAFPLGVFFMFVALLMLSVSYLTKYFLLLAATDKRIMVRHGIINLDVIQMRYNKVESVEVSRTIMGQLLRYASVVITGTGSRVTVIPFVADANAFRDAANKVLFEMDEKGADDGK